MAEGGKAPFYKRWWFWLIIIIVILIIIISNCGGNNTTQQNNVNNQTGGTATNNSNNNTNTAKTTDPTKQVYKVGDKVKLGSNILTVTKVTKSNGTEFDKPQQGKEYVIVAVEIENGGNDNIDYNPFDFKMKNSKGQITDSGIITVDSDTALQSGQLAPGGKVSGTIPFEEPIGDKGLQLQYTPSFLSDKTIKIDLQYFPSCDASQTMARIIPFYGYFPFAKC